MLESGHWEGSRLGYGLLQKFLIRKIRVSFKIPNPSHVAAALDRTPPPAPSHRSHTVPCSGNTSIIPTLRRLCVNRERKIVQNPSSFVRRCRPIACRRRSHPIAWSHPTAWSHAIDAHRSSLSSGLFVCRVGKRKDHLDL